LHVLYLFPPGVFTVVLAVLAAVTSLPIVNEKLRNRWLHALAIFIFCLIAAGEIAIIQHADSVNESHFQYIVSRFDNTDRLVVANAAAQQRLAALAAAQPIVKPHIAQAASLKERIVRLSADILSFLTQRQAGEPPLPRRETWNQDVQDDIRYMQQTMAIYSQTYAPKVIAFHDELASKGLTDNELDSFYQNPTNPTGIRIVAEHLGALAERLPD